MIKINPSSAAILKAIKEKDSAYWERVRKQKALSLFRRAAEQVPAYKDFLKKHKVDPDKIKTYEDFKLVPITEKKNYLRKYQLADLTWGGSLKKPLVFTSTSGSTGRPVYFHRSFQLDWQSSVMHELYYEFGRKANGPTLVIICFGMGVWIGGLITYQAFRLMKERGHNLSIITPGINKEEIFRALENLSPLFGQTILIGYPPFVKDVIDEANDKNIDLKSLKLRILCAAEPFTERFRHYLADKAVADVSHSVVNIYGTADLGTMAMETPLSITIRSLATKEAKIFHGLFGEINKTPTLAQYIPEFVSFDTGPDGSLVITGENSVPLIRYSLGDHGGVYNASELENKLKDWGAKIKFNQHLPFVYVYERIDMSAKLYGAIIYPEHIRDALQDSVIDDWVTGKFVMSTKYNRNLAQYLEIIIELRKNVTSSRVPKNKVKQIIVNELLGKNAEFRNNYNFLGSKMMPRLIFKEYSHPRHFKPGIKQGWVKK